MLRKIILARHQGFCMGVRRAIQIAEETAARRLPGERVTILNEIVHNEAVVEQFRRRGVGQERAVAKITEGTVIVAAHGVAPDVIAAAEKKGLQVVNATCPLVTRIYGIITEAIARDYYIVHYGDQGHDETAGIVGHAPNRIVVVDSEKELLALPDWPERKLGLTVQTTAHAALYERVKELARKKWPHIEVFDTICNATTRRQQAVLDIAPEVNLILVVGSKTSANSKRLVQISRDACGRGELVGSAADIQSAWFADGNVERVGVTAGASTPQFLVDEVVSCLVRLSGGKAEVVMPPDSIEDGETGSGYLSASP